MVFNQISLRFDQIISFIQKTKTPIPLILDLLKLQKDTYIAETYEEHRVMIRPRTGERFAFYENLIRMDYLKNGVMLEAGDTVVDIGANIGCFTILAASIVGPSGRVIAIEPEPLTYGQLCDNIKLNKLSNVTTLNIAVGERNEQIEFHVSPNSLYSSIYTEVGDHRVEGETIKVNSQTLESLLNQLKIDRVRLLKMDCEGAEYGICASMTPSIASRIDQISMELHKVSEHKPDELISRINELGFQIKRQYPLFAWR